MQDEKIARMTEMLLGGGKMLSVHCGACKGPLFQFEGKVVCPVCGEKAKVVKAEVKPKAAPTEKVESVLRAKLNSLAEEIAKETNHNKTIELLDRVKSILEVLEKLKEG